MHLPRDISLRSLEAHYVLMCLERNGNNRTRCCKEIGIKLRTFRNRLSEFKVEGYIVPEPDRRPTIKT
jgi:DNA-binding NtrC family response regulator